MQALAALMLAGSMLAITPPSRTIVIDMVRDEHGQTYFAPRDVVAAPGDTLRFVARGGTHDVYFLPDSNAGAHNLPPRTALVEKAGEILDVVVTLAPGRYYFQCDPHVSRGMIGHLSVVPLDRSPVVLLVRHAEKAPSASLDPPISAAGQKRAEALVDVARDAGVTRVIVDQSQRTQQTAVPFARQQGLHADVVPIDWNDPTSQVHAIADSVKRGGAVTLVIGHRNTIPAIIRALGGPPIPEMKDADYNDLYVLVLGTGSTAPVLIHASYGVGLSHIP